MVEALKTAKAWPVRWQNNSECNKSCSEKGAKCIQEFIEFFKNQISPLFFDAIIAKNNCDYNLIACLIFA